MVRWQEFQCQCLLIKDKWESWSSTSDPHCYSRKPLTYNFIVSLKRSLHAWFFSVAKLIWRSFNWSSDISENNIGHSVFCAQIRSLNRYYIKGSNETPVSVSKILHHISFLLVNLGFTMPIELYAKNCDKIPYNTLTWRTMFCL